MSSRAWVLLAVVGAGCGRPDVLVTTVVDAAEIRSSYAHDASTVRTIRLGETFPALDTGARDPAFWVLRFPVREGTAPPGLVARYPLAGRPHRVIVPVAVIRSGTGDRSSEVDRAEVGSVLRLWQHPSAPADATHALVVEGGVAVGYARLADVVPEP